ncbi:ras guanine nucleotide exchange factor domain-containing protein [Chytriomyces sp. MP71]|nr:ras guanine nucleotide exchange factor domain-containing protein [Chytriomyces sp. MP71]
MHSKILIAALEFGNDHKDGFCEVLNVLTHNVDLLCDNSPEFSVPELKLAFTTASRSIGHILALVGLAGSVLPCLNEEEAAFIRAQTLEVRRNFAKLQIEFSQVCLGIVREGKALFSSVELKERVARVRRLLVLLWRAVAKGFKPGSTPIASAEKNGPLVAHHDTSNLLQRLQSMKELALLASQEQEHSSMFVHTSHMMDIFDSTVSSLWTASSRFLVDVALQEHACSLIATVCGVDDNDDWLDSVNEVVAVVEAAKVELARKQVPVRERSLKAVLFSLESLAHALDPGFSDAPGVDPEVVDHQANKEPLSQAAFEEELKALTEYVNNESETLAKSSALFSEPYIDDNNIPHGRKLIAATLPFILARITAWNPTPADLTLRDTILKTYTSFTTPQELLSALSAHFKAVAMFPEDLPSRLHDAYATHVVEGTRVAALELMRTWLIVDYARVTEVAATKAELAEFVEYGNETCVSTAEVEALEGLSRLLERKPSKRRAVDYSDTFKNPVVEDKRKLRIGRGKSLLEMDGTRIAEQLALIDGEIYVTITAAEMMDPEGSAKDVNTGFAALLQRFNFVVGLVSTAVIHLESPKMRALMIAQFVKVAKHCTDLRALNPACAIVSCLSSASLFRLTNTWAKVPAPVMETLDSLKSVFSHKANFSFQRTLLSSFETQAPCVPWLGFFNHDVIFIKESQSRSMDGKVNLSRCHQLAKAVDSALRFQGATYTFAKDKEMWDFLTLKGGLLVTQSTQYAASLKAEARKARK